MSGPAQKRCVRIVHLEDSLRDRDMVLDTLENEGFECEIRHVETREEFEAALANNDIDLIVSDHSLPTFDGSTALKLTREKWPEMPFIFLTGSLGDESAVEKMKNGATDYVLKHHIERLAPAIRRALGESSERQLRQRAEVRVRQSDELFRQISENIQDLIAILSPDGRRIYNSSSYRALLGEPDSLRDTDSFADVHPDDRERICQLFRHTVATGQGQRTEYRLLTRDGSIRFVESQGSVIRDEGGKIVSVLVVSRDVTGRRIAEQALREQAALLDKAHDAIYVRDLNQRITYWNQGAERLYGWRAVEAIGRRADELLYREETEQILEVRRQVMEKGEWAGELKQLTRDGREIIVQARRTLLYDEKHRPYCILNINSDITEKKLIHEQLLRTQRMESIGAMAGGVAHDLNNVLAPILMATDLLRMEVGSESGLAMLDTMKSSAQRGSEMVRQILSFARGSGSKHTLLQAAHLLAEIARFAKDTFPAAIAVKSQVPKDLYTVNGNPTQLHQVLLNLCVNARDAMPSGGTLWLTAENARVENRLFRGEEKPVTGRFIVLSVSDTGTGIPAAILARIFSPFFTTKGEGKGTGIGLSTVRDIVKAHGGHVDVESQVGVGSRFRVYLPAAEKDAGPPPGKGELILVMDDELALLEITKGLLESYNYRVVTAVNGADALVVFHKHSAEIRGVIADMATPVMDGGALIHALGEIAPQVKIIAVSGQQVDQRFTSAQCPNVHSCLTKPYSTEQILATLHEMLKT